MNEDDPGPLLDRGFLDAQTGGDPALAAEVLALFAAQTERLVPMIRDEALPSRERRDAAHTLKGGAQAIGACRVAALAGDIETALDTGEAARLSVLGAALLRAAEATRAAAA